MEELKDKVVFLTGGTEGIGFECAKAYHAAGAVLAVISNSKESIQNAKKSLDHHTIRYFQADVSKAQDVQNAIHDTVQIFGKIDVIHNNVGVAHPSKALHDTTEEEWQVLFDVNVKSIYLTTKYGIDILKQTKGCILNTSSLVGEIGQELHAAYTATKGAINALTKSMALDYAHYVIRVNAVAPAGVWTPMLHEWSRLQSNGNSIKNYLNDIHALGYCPEGDVIADACVFLISDKARFITGCIMPVSGGAELGYKRTNGKISADESVISAQ